jgi:hypothetical protein
MYVAHVIGPNVSEHNSDETILHLRANSFEDAKNELFSYFGLIPGVEGYYPSSALASARIYQIADSQDVDIETQRETKAMYEAALIAEQEEQAEMARMSKHHPRKQKARK